MKLQYWRFFDIRVLQYRSTDLQYRRFFISGCFNIEAYLLWYQSTDLQNRSYISYRIAKLNHWPSISKSWYSKLSIYRYRVFGFDIEAWQGSRCVHTIYRDVPCTIRLADTLIRFQKCINLNMYIHVYQFLEIYVVHVTVCTMSVPHTYDSIERTWWHGTVITDIMIMMSVTVTVHVMPAWAWGGYSRCSAQFMISLACMPMSLSNYHKY